MFNFNKIKKAAADLISIIVSVVIISALVLGIMLFLSNKVRSTAMDEINNTMNTITGIAEANRNNTDIVIPGGPGGGEIPEGPQTPVATSVRFNQKYIIYDFRQNEGEAIMFKEDGTAVYYDRSGEVSYTTEPGSYEYSGNNLYRVKGDGTRIKEFEVTSNGLCIIDVMYTYDSFILEGTYDGRYDNENYEGPFIRYGCRYASLDSSINANIIYVPNGDLVWYNYNSGEIKVYSDTIVSYELGAYFILVKNEYLSDNNEFKDMMNENGYSPLAIVRDNGYYLEFTETNNSKYSMPI